MKLTHHIKSTDPAGVMHTYCGKQGVRAMGGGIDIAGKWSPCTSNPLPNAGSCPACVEGMPAGVKPPSIYTDLKASLGREPTNKELIKRCAEEEVVRNKRNARAIYNKAKRDMRKKK